MGCQACALLATLNTECVNADNLNESAAEAFRNHPDYTIITSFPGLGEATGARVLAEIGDDRGRFADARGLKSFAGAAPVTRASGRTISITHRHVKNNRLVAVGFVWAFAAPRDPARSRTTTPGAEHTATGTLRRCATSLIDFRVSSITAFTPVKPTMPRRPFQAPSTVRNRRQLDSLR